MIPTEIATTIGTATLCYIDNGDLFEADGYLYMATPNTEGEEPSDRKRMVVKLEDGSTYWMRTCVEVVVVGVETFEIMRGRA